MATKNKLLNVDIRNKKIYHDFFVGDCFEAGLVLTGTEVKSIRLGKVQLSDAFVRFTRSDSPVLFNANISKYDFGNVENHEPARSRKLLLNRSEINKLKIAVKQDGKTILPTKMYFVRGRAKVEIAVCKAKKLFDKREDLKKRTEMKEAQRVLSAINHR